MKVGSLFSGAGGLDIAVEHVFSGRTVWHCELDFIEDKNGRRRPNAAVKVLAHRWPGVPNLGDISTVDWSTVEPVDVLCGGFPCQDISAAGKRAGMGAGTRSGLWSEFARAIDELRPRVVVIENVRNLLSVEANRTVEPREAAMGDSDAKPVLRALGAVLGDLCDVGYDAQWATVSAASVGAPHLRERVFVVATPADTSHATGDGERTRTESRRGSCAAAESACNGRTCVDDGASSPGARCGREWIAGGSAGREPVSLDLLPTPRARDGKGRDPNPRGIDLNEAISLLPTPNASDGTGGGQHPDQREGHSRQLIDFALLHGSEQWGKYAPAITRWASLTRPAPSPTEPNTKGNPRLSAPFPEWMMGWPAGWVTAVPGISRNDMLRIIGNGVCPQQAAAALWQLLPVCELAA
ncbi:DNA cytosine methyltransferase [Mycolicibacterium canariasense]|uniref:DNA cytosine methyltransferase n=1 Tax=Mycolicibacterium canariasense TaxID=228230 RepID=UPI0032D57E75